MSEIENLKKLNLYEKARNIFLQFDLIQNTIREIKYRQIREALSEMLNTCQGNLTILLDAAYALEQCESDFDVNELLKCFSGCESEGIGYGSL
jgi:hypothetical protein